MKLRKHDIRRFASKRQCSPLKGFHVALGQALHPPRQPVLVDRAGIAVILGQLPIEPVQGLQKALAAGMHPLLIAVQERLENVRGGGVCLIDGFAYLHGIDRWLSLDLGVRIQGGAFGQNFFGVGNRGGTLVGSHLELLGRAAFLCR